MRTKATPEGINTAMKVLVVLVFAAVAGLWLVERGIL